MDIRPRRLRGNEILRNMVRETIVSSNSLVLPLFVREGKGIKEGITSLYGQIRYSPDTIVKGVETGLKSGVRSFMLFGIPNSKDEFGTSAYAENGVIQEAVRQIKKEFGSDAYIITDVCLCEYTSHGHCGIIDGENVDNDLSLPVLAKVALSHAASGADMVAPSDMMDGRINAMRKTLDENGYKNTPIMSYSAKYSSAFYGPFREAAGSTPQFGDRKTYQMDYHNGKEGIKEVLLDISEGADIVMVKPALSYLDIISEISKTVNVPVAAYSVSGEYAMIKTAARQNLIDEYGVMCETAIGVFRAGADILITYFAKELAEAIKRGDIG